MYLVMSSNNAAYGIRFEVVSFCVEPKCLVAKIPTFILKYNLKKKFKNSIYVLYATMKYRKV